MEGQAAAPAAGTILNALATGTGSAFAIDEYTTATVSLDGGAASGGDGGTADGGSGGDGPGTVTGEIAEDPDGDARLIERCVELVTERFGDGQGGRVRTESEVPMAAGLKSSSAAANATVMATLDALDAVEAVSREDACRIGVEAARDVGVTATGAFDDASASMLGGMTITDNTADRLRSHETVDWDVLVYTPPERAYSADADVDRCELIAPMARLVEDLAVEGNYGRAMTVNGLAFAAALEFDPEPMVEAMADVEGVSLSGTGPSVTAVGERAALETVATRWERRSGEAWLTTTQTEGTRVL